MSALFLLFAATCITLSAQSIKIQEGSLAPLKDEKSISVEFTYDNMGVGKFDKEEDYVNKKKEEYNKKEAGRGDNWAEAWVSDRKHDYEPSFIELFEKNSDMTVSMKPTKYTMIFHTTYTEPGYNIYVSRKNASIDAEVKIVETANRSNVVAVISIRRAPGRTFGGNDYDTGIRIKECYADAGKYLGKFFEKNRK
ncbi:MAG: hypothetical protein JST47_01745 [Bacteroidetes bacterium]|nr:hypothetical protein [Bacteroidota bacterium]MBS1974065.1 hypothetical protein [Bacteroidota bacterium]